MKFESIDERVEIAVALNEDFLAFMRVFYEELTGRPFNIPQPLSRRSHVYIVAEALTDVFNLKIPNLNINLPPGHFKSTMLSFFVAWAYSQYPDCNFIYASFSRDLAAGHTGVIRSIMELPAYTALYGVSLKRDSRARDDFYTTAGGRIYASGIGGTITGVNAGLPFCDRFSGALIIDDAHKISEVQSDTVRNKDHADFDTTLSPRPRSPTVPILHLGQRVHEADLSARFVANREIRDWTTITLASLDQNDNALAPEIISKDELLRMRELKPYLFYAQHQQQPTPAGGALFKTEWFEILEKEPEMLVTFITVDTAETEKTYNDATSFSFLGVYKIIVNNRDTGQLGLHIINNREIWVEPADLEHELMSFYHDCMLYPTTPDFVAIEKKSTGVTLISSVKRLRGIRVMEIERTRKSGSKSQRFIDAQGFIAQRLVSLPRYASHTANVLDHMSKISPSMTQVRDDIADTICDGIELTFVSKVAYNPTADKYDEMLDRLAAGQAQLTQLDNARYAR